MLDLKELLVNQDLLVRQDPWVQVVLVEMKENKDLSVLLVTKDFKETKEFQDCQDFVEQEENLDLREKVVFREPKDREDLKEPWAH